MCSSTHRLSAKGSRDASLHVESTRAWRFCGCVRGRAARLTHEITHLDGRAVGLYMIYQCIYNNNMLISIKILIMKIIMKLSKQMSFFIIYILYRYDYII